MMEGKAKEQHVEDGVMRTRRKAFSSTRKANPSDVKYPRQHSHVVMQYFLLFSVIPLNGDTSPITANDYANVFCVAAPLHAGTDI
jgi:hypothetical protein